MKLTFLSILAFAAILVAPSCSKKDNGPSNAAQVMFVNGVAGTSSVSVSVNNATVNNASNLSFPRGSGYQNITAGSENIVYSINGSGLTTPLVSSTATFAANTHYSVFAGGIFTAPLLVTTTDDLTQPTGSNTKIRFINLSSDTLNASCYVGSVKLDSNISYGSYTSFHQIVAVTAQVSMLDPASPIVNYNLLNQTFAAGKIYTVILSGTKHGTGSALPNLTIIQNN